MKKLTLVFAILVSFATLTNSQKRSAPINDQISDELMVKLFEELNETFLNEIDVEFDVVYIYEYDTEYIKQASDLYKEYFKNEFEEHEIKMVREVINERREGLWTLHEMWEYMPMVVKNAPDYSKNFTIGKIIKTCSDQNKIKEFEYAYSYLKERNMEKAIGMTIRFTDSFFNESNEDYNSKKFEENVFFTMDGEIIFSKTYFEL